MECKIIVLISIYPDCINLIFVFRHQVFLFVIIVGRIYIVFGDHRPASFRDRCRCKVIRVHSSKPVTGEMKRRFPPRAQIYTSTCTQQTIVAFRARFFIMPQRVESNRALIGAFRLPAVVQGLRHYSIRASPQELIGSIPIMTKT